MISPTEVDVRAALFLFAFAVLLSRPAHAQSRFVYGSVGDGVTDDSDAFRRALDTGRIPESRDPALAIAGVDF